MEISVVSTLMNAAVDICGHVSVRTVFSVLLGRTELLGRVELCLIVRESAVVFSKAPEPFSMPAGSGRRLQFLLLLAHANYRAFSFRPPHWVGGGLGLRLPEDDWS